MKQFIIAAAMLGAASLPALAQGQNQGGNGGNYSAAPGPVIGAGLPAVAAGLGFGAYLLMKRRRRKTKV